MSTQNSYAIKAELHCHTNRHLRVFYFPLIYEAVQTEEEVLNACVQKNIKFLAITDHNSLAGYQVAKKIVDEKHLPIILIPACEISSSGGHILAYNITELIPSDLSPAETVNKIHAQGGIAIAAHPYAPLGLNKLVFSANFDGVEIYNSLVPNQFNLLAQKQLLNITLSKTVGSDAHILQNIGKAMVLFPEGTTTLDQAIACLKSGNFQTSRSSSHFFLFLFLQFWANIVYFFRHIFANR
jgi:predicted metal-dependent phosphoesterase TrpH